jgi:hypothetical protein
MSHKEGEWHMAERKIPTLSAEERRQALDAAVKARAERAAVMEKMKAGELTIAEIIERKDDPIYGRIKVKSLLRLLPGIGIRKAETFMEEAGISENRRIRGLGRRQAEKVIKFEEEHPRA